MEQFSTHNAFAKGRRRAAWLYDPVLQKLLAVLSEAGDEARVVGGAVRNTLLRQPVQDIDIATTVLPAQVLARARQNGFHTVPVGAEFGTVLVMAGKHKFQVTTLRADIETNGRHAKVRFCRDWAQDAARRDFTMNALYVDKDGKLYDYAGGLEDAENGRLRFIGEASARIKEDYLRILRFFRFYALLARGRPDVQALKAVAALKGGLERLSVERIWDEFKKLLSVPNPFRSLLWMRSCGVLDLVLPESAKWGIDALQGLIENEEGAKGGGADALLRLMALIPPQSERVEILAKRLRLSSREKRRLLDWAAAAPIAADMGETELKKRIYLANRRRKAESKGEEKDAGAAATKACAAPQAVLDVLRIACANARIYGRQEEGRLYAALLHVAHNWQAPPFPLDGSDMAAMGLHGAAIGKALKKLETEWIESGFALNKQVLLEKI